MRQALADGVEFDVAFVEPAGLRVAVAGGRLGTVATVLRREPTGRWIAMDHVKPAAAADEVLELAVPLDSLTLAPGRPDVLSFFIAVTRAGVEVTRYPSYAPITTRVPPIHAE